MIAGERLTANRSTGIVRAFTVLSFKVFVLLALK